MVKGVEPPQRGLEASSEPSSLPNRINTVVGILAQCTGADESIQADLAAILEPAVKAGAGQAWSDKLAMALSELSEEGM